MQGLVCAARRAARSDSESTTRLRGAGGSHFECLTEEPRMPDAIADRVRRYVLDGSDEDLRRLLGVSHASADMARSALRRIGVQEGWRAIECGCGPIGALPVMAEMVGPSGTVVGVDFSEQAVQRARSIAAELRLDNVELVCGDVHDLDSR